MKPQLVDCYVLKWFTKSFCSVCKRHQYYLRTIEPRKKLIKSIFCTKCRYFHFLCFIMVLLQCFDFPNEFAFALLKKSSYVCMRLLYRQPYLRNIYPKRVVNITKIMLPILKSKKKLTTTMNYFDSNRTITVILKSNRELIWPF